MLGMVAQCVSTDGACAKKVTARLMGTVSHTQGAIKRLARIAVLGMHVLSYGGKPIVLLANVSVNLMLALRPTVSVIHSAEGIQEQRVLSSIALGIHYVIHTLTNASAILIVVLIMVFVFRNQSTTVRL